MTIPIEVVREATAVASKAQEKVGFQNPYVSLQNLECLCQGDEILTDCLRDVAIYSLRYAETVCRFQQIVLAGAASNEDGTREEIERVRTNIHDATMDTINILSRTMKRAGKDNSWIVKLTAGGRAAYGKFSILLAFELTLQNQPK